MSYYSAEEMKKTLKDYPKFQKRLYCRGFLITNEKQNVNLEYPFYANWKEETIGYSFYMYTHKETYAYTYERNHIRSGCSADKHDHGFPDSPESDAAAKFPPGPRAQSPFQFPDPAHTRYCSSSSGHNSAGSI